jgi:hypothetical protein
MWLAWGMLWFCTYLASLLIGYLIGSVHSWNQGFEAGIDARHLVPKEPARGGDT